MWLSAWNWGEALVKKATVSLSPDKQFAGVDNNLQSSQENSPSGATDCEASGRGPCPRGDALLLAS